MKYWLTFNEINSVLHFPFMSGGIPGNPSTQELYQAVHHELVASARVVWCGHEIDPDNKIGCMILAVPRYPLSPTPDDARAAQRAAQSDYAFGDIHCRGY